MNAQDNCRYAANAEQRDTDSDGLGDACQNTTRLDGGVARGTGCACRNTNAGGGMLWLTLGLGVWLRRRRPARLERNRV